MVVRFTTLTSPLGDPRTVEENAVAFLSRRLGGAYVRSVGIERSAQREGRQRVLHEGLGKIPDRSRDRAVGGNVARLINAFFALQLACRDVMQHHAGIVTVHRQAAALQIVRSGRSAGALRSRSPSRRAAVHDPEVVDKSPSA